MLNFTKYFLFLSQILSNNKKRTETLYTKEKAKKKKKNQFSWKIYEKENPYKKFT